MGSHIYEMSCDYPFNRIYTEIQLTSSNSSLDQSFCFGLVSDEWVNSKKRRFDNGNWFVRNDQHSIGFNPSKQ